MKADINDRLSQQINRENKKSTFIIIALSTLLLGALTGLAVMQTKNIETKEQAEKLAKKLEREKQANTKSGNYVDVDEFIKQNKTTKGTKQPGQQKNKTKTYSGLSKAITIDDLPPSKNPINIYTPQSYSAEPKATNKQKKKSTHKVKWGWDLRAGKYIPENEGIFYYTLYGNNIDTTTVCNNYEYGSITRRNCRKAAKQWFKDNCSKDFMAACGATSMRP